MYIVLLIEVVKLVMSVCVRLYNGCTLPIKMAKCVGHKVSIYRTINNWALGGQPAQVTCHLSSSMLNKVNVKYIVNGLHLQANMAIRLSHGHTCTCFFNNKSC